MESVYQFTDYRAYLKAFYDDRKRSSAGYSYRHFSLAAGIGAPNYLKLVIDGKRRLTVPNIFEFARALGLEGDELRYFEALVLCNQSTLKREREYYGRRLAELRGRKPARQSRLPVSQVLERWYHPAVLLCLDGRDPEAAFAMIERSVGIARAEAEAAIASLLKLGLVRLDGDGLYRMGSDQFVMHDPKRVSRIQREFLRQQLERSVRAFARQYDSGAKFYSHCMTAPSLAFVHEKVKAFLEDLTREADAAGAECELVQVNIQAFGPA